MLVPAFLSTPHKSAPRENREKEKEMLIAAVTVVLLGVMLFLNRRTHSTSQDKGHVSDSWLAANRAASRTTD